MIVLSLCPRCGLWKTRTGHRLTNIETALGRMIWIGLENLGDREMSAERIPSAQLFEVVPEFKAVGIALTKEIRRILVRTNNLLMKTMKKACEPTAKPAFYGLSVEALGTDTCTTAICDEDDAWHVRCFSSRPAR